MQKYTEELYTLLGPCGLVDKSLERGKDNDYTGNKGLPFPFLLLRETGHLQFAHLFICLGETSGSLGVQVV